MTAGTSDASAKPVGGEKNMIASVPVTPRDVLSYQPDDTNCTALDEVGT